MRTLPVSLITISFAIVSGCGSEREKSPRNPNIRRVTVKTVDVAEVDWPSAYEAAGTVQSRGTAQVSSRLMANVREVMVAVGDHVTVGQRLAVLDSRDLETRQTQSEAAAQEARTGAAEADSAMESAKANLELAESSFQRMKTLFDRKSISNQEFDEASARLRTAKANLEMAAARRKVVDSRIAQASEALTAAKIAREYSILTAPFSGTITARNIEPGDLATPGAPLLTIERRDGYRFHAIAGEAHLASVRSGGMVTVALDSLDRTLAGTVSEIAPAIDAAGHSFLVKIELPAAAGLRSGLFGRASFPSGTRKTLAVPESAIVDRGQMRWVFVSEEGAARGRIITTGRARDGNVEALSGISAGEKVISPVPRNLSDGAPVEVVP